MSKVVSRDQALGVIATAMVNIDWNNLNGDSLQTDVAQLPPQELGRRFTAFLNNGCRLVIKTVEKGAGVVIEKTTRLLKEIAKIAIGATAEKKTTDSFKGKRYYYRAPELDSWLAKVQPAGEEGDLTVHQLEKEMSFREVAAAVLGVDDASLDELEKGLINGGHTVVPAQIESLIEQTDTGQSTELRTDGYGNFFFVINKDGGVSVVHADRSVGRRWCVYVHRLGYGYRWGVEYRFFSRN